MNQQNIAREDLRQVSIDATQHNRIPGYFSAASPGHSRN